MKERWGDQASDFAHQPLLRERLGKPASALARAKKVLRPLNLLRDTAACDEGAPTLCFEGWRAILERRQLISPDGRDVSLRGCEFKLLSVFLKHPGRVLSRQHLMDVTHGTGWHAYERTVDAQISRLRKKIETDPKHPKLIKSVHGDGYVFTATVSRFLATRN